MILLYVLVHIVIHQQNEKCREDINGCDSGKGIMHTVKSKEGSGCRGDIGVLEQPFGKQIHQRKNHNAKKSRHKTPAKGCHAENKNPKGN